MAEYKVQINAKIGDHLVNVCGDSAEDAYAELKKLVAHFQELHEALSTLDGGRSATEIVQKEKTWGARSQGGRTYTKSNSGSPGNFSGNSAPAPASAPTGQTCPTHNAPTKRVEGGVNKAGRKYSPSIRCDGPPSHVIEWIDEN